MRRTWRCDSTAARRWVAEIDRSLAVIAPAARGSVTRLLGAVDALGRAEAAARVAAERARGADPAAARLDVRDERQRRRHRLGPRRRRGRALGAYPRADRRAGAADAQPEWRLTCRHRLLHRCR